MRIRAALLTLLAVPALLPAQTHRVARTDEVTRAVGVYEWTGDRAKPTASRLVPVSLFLQGHYEDAAIYLAQPVPLALRTDTRYELQTAGVPKDFLDIGYARNLRGPDATATSFDDGWFGYGKIHALPKPKPNAKKGGGPEYADRITLDDDSKDKKKDNADPERPTLQRPNTKTTATKGKGKAPKDTSSVSQTPPQPDDDPDRPVLHKNAPAAASDTPESAESSDSYVTTSTGTGVDDPSRPGLHRGIPTDNTAPITGPSQLTGAPVDLHQQVAVSDPATRAPHDFEHRFGAEGDRTDVLKQMEALARAGLETPKPPPPPVPAKGPARSKRVLPPAPIVDVQLFDEELRAYDLTYSGSATYVYTTRTSGDFYLAVIAQPDVQGKLQLAMRSVTDAAHLDSKPRMRLVDAVDADGSDRGLLLFELREKSTRQFALYRVSGGKADQVFVSGSTQ